MQQQFVRQGHVGWCRCPHMQRRQQQQQQQQRRQLLASAADGRADIPLSAQSVPYNSNDFVEVGLISRAHGVRGEVKVQLITDEPQKRLGTPNKRLWLLPPQGRGLGAAAAAAAAAAGGGAPLLRRVVVQSGRVARPAAGDRGAEWAVKFKEVLGRDEAQLLSGHKLLLALCDREADTGSSDEFFISDLVGCRVLDAGSSVLLGVVTEVYDTSASYSLLRVRLAPDEADIEQSRFRSVLVPFVESMVPTVEVGQRRLLLAAPDGLMDAASTTKLQRPYTAADKQKLRKQLRDRQLEQQQQQANQVASQVAPSAP